MRITLVVAASENDVIGLDGDLPWRLPADLAHFKRVTMGKPSVMGRMTWGSIGRPLPGRLNIVLSRNPSTIADGCVVVDSLDRAEEVAAAEGSEELVVIGGSGVGYTVLLKGLSVTSEGNLVIVDGGRKSLQTFDPELNYLYTFVVQEGETTIEELGSPTVVLVVDNYIIVSEVADSRLTLFSF